MDLESTSRSDRNQIEGRKEPARQQRVYKSLSLSLLLSLHWEISSKEQ
jgi:hypothetical protein